jgi:hypothetical protein
MAGRWTRQQDATLRRQYRAGVPRQRIAAALGRSSNAVDARRRRSASPPTHAPVPGRALPTTCSAPPTLQDCRSPRWRGGSAGRPQRSAGDDTCSGCNGAVRAWTPAEDQELGRAWRQRDELARLGRRLGRSPAALRLRAVKLGLVQPPRRCRWQPDEDHRLRPGYAQG